MSNTKYLLNYNSIDSLIGLYSLVLSVFERTQFKLILKCLDINRNICGISKRKISRLVDKFYEERALWEIDKSLNWVN